MLEYRQTDQTHFHHAAHFAQQRPYHPETAQISVSPTSVGMGDAGGPREPGKHFLRSTFHSPVIFANPFEPTKVSDTEGYEIAGVWAWRWVRCVVWASAFHRTHISKHQGSYRQNR